MRELGEDLPEEAFTEPRCITLDCFGERLSLFVGGVGGVFGDIGEFEVVAESEQVSLLELHNLS